MPELAMRIEGAHAVPFAAAPMLAFRLQVSSGPEQVIHTAVLRCQIQIEAARRRYEAADQERLRDLFGTPDRWSQTLRSMLWTHTSAVVPSFTGSTVVDLQAPCSFDFNIAATKYFHGLSDGDIPLCLMFSGTFFYADQTGALQVAPIPWNVEARFRLPVKTWRDMMDHHYPDSAWLCLQREAFERLQQFKVRRGIPTWEGAIEELLHSVNEPASHDGAGRKAVAREALRL